MIPRGGVLGGNRYVELMQQPSRTYRIDPVTKRMIGMTDGLEAVKQTVMKILQTERFEFLIYSGNHGSELGDIPGKSEAYLRSELGRRIRSALVQDDRIQDVQGMQISISGDEALAQFTVVTQYGKFEMTKEV